MRRTTPPGRAIRPLSLKSNAARSSETASSCRSSPRSFRMAAIFAIDPIDEPTNQASVAARDATPRANLTDMIDAIRDISRDKNCIGNDSSMSLLPIGEMKGRETRYLCPHNRVDLVDMIPCNQPAALYPPYSPHPAPPHKAT